MHKQIPSIGNQRARQECATGNRIDERETNPYLPENCKDRDWHDAGRVALALDCVARSDVFAEGPCNGSACEKRTGVSRFERRDRKQHDCEHGSN